MESLACSISFWEDALLTFSSNNLNNTSNKLLSSEDSQFCKELQLLVDSAYSLQDQCQLLFLDQVSGLTVSFYFLQMLIIFYFIFYSEISIIQCSTL